MQIPSSISSPVLQEEDDEFLSTRARKFLLSSSLVRDACVSRLQINYKKDLISVKMYERFYSKWAVSLYYTFAIINLGTIFIEYPSVILINKQSPSYQIPLVINFICEAYFYYRWYIINEISEKGKWNNLASKASIIILLLMSLDAIVYIVCQHVPNATPVRWSRFLRPILLLTFPENRRLRAAFINLRFTAVDVLPVFCLLLACVGLVSIVAVTAIASQGLKYPNGTPYFISFTEVFWELYVLTTSANSPDVIIPAYEHNRFYITLYIFVSTVCNWLFLGILTACVYNSYKSHLGESVMSAVSKRKKRLDEAFRLVATHSPTGELGISQGTFMRLMRIAKPGRSEDALRVIFHILDNNRSGYLSMGEFGRLAEYIRTNLVEVELSRKHFETFVPKFYHLYTSSPFQAFKRLAEHRVIKWFFISLVVANGMTAVLLRNFPTIQETVEWFFTFVFLIELVLNYVTCGGVRFFDDGWNIFDCVIVFGALFSQMLQGGLEAMGITVIGGITQVLLLIRLLRLLKLLSVVPSFKAISNCIMAILPSLSAYAIILLILYYIYACLGMEVFSYFYEPPEDHNYTRHNSCHAAALRNTDFARWHYCLFNFNSITESYIMLFVITVGNNWQVLADGITRVTSRWARMFFLLIHWTCVLLVLNVILAFIIEAFLIEYDAHATKFEMYVHQRLEELGMDAQTELEKRGIKGYGQPGFHMTHKQLELAFPPNSPAIKAFLLKADVASLEVLMFRMFEREVEDLIANYRSSIQQQYRSRDAYAQLNS
ncbi:Two pore calcium channel protein 1 [Paragonimus heterotremus]|uniref:Two pore calcium channel protein 1 n=1 Tax=Paragonimus heterotremus TaxID=100268 RepID=A0A8J4T0I4_9TREM|nr:Two pore calcium channel protein 1 [Paragonimus heterotremus]